jgi:hypothetical protein
MERIRFIPYRGKQILLVDLVHCSAAECEDTLRTTPDYVTGQSRGSVLLLADFTGALFDADAMRTLQQTTVFNKPYVKKAAWIGTESLPVLVRETVSKFSRREFPVFKSKTEALKWLTED